MLRSLVFIGLALFGSAATCDILGDADDIKFDLTLTHTFVIDERLDSKGSPVAYAKVELIDATKDVDFNRYKDKITDIKVNSVGYSASDYSAPAKVNFSNGKASFYAPGTTTSPFATADLVFQDIQAAASTGQVFSLNFTTGLDKVSSSLKDTKTLAIGASGTLSKTPVAVKVRVVVKCTVTAEVL